MTESFKAMGGAMLSTDDVVLGAMIELDEQGVYPTRRRLAEETGLPFGTVNHARARVLASCYRIVTPPPPQARDAPEPAPPPPAEEDEYRWDGVIPAEVMEEARRRLARDGEPPRCEAHAKSWAWIDSRGNAARSARRRDVLGTIGNMKFDHPGNDGNKEACRRMIKLFRGVSRPWSRGAGSTPRHTTPAG